jgi:REP-associated tyrosine transposase
MPVLLYLRMTYYKRNLPHWHPRGRAIFITWRLAGTLPRVLLAKLRSSSEPASRKFALADRVLDCAVCGPCWLAQAEIAQAVQGCMLKGALELRYFEMKAYVVMPNHVHMLIEPGVPLERITRGIKGRSAHLANCILGRVRVPFWQDESFDHWVRKPAEGEKICRYIENNPVKAGLVQTPCEWPWSSAAPLSSTGIPACAISITPRD